MILYGDSFIIESWIDFNDTVFIFNMIESTEDSGESNGEVLFIDHRLVFANNQGLVCHIQEILKNSLFSACIFHCILKYQYLYYLRSLIDLNYFGLYLFQLLNFDPILLLHPYFHLHEPNSFFFLCFSI